MENAIKIARAYTRKQAVACFDHAYHGRTNLTMALTAKSMPYKERLRAVRAGDLPGTDVLPYRDGLIDKEWGTNGELAAERALTVIDKADRRGQPGRDHHRADPGRGRIHRSRTGFPACAAPLVYQQQRGVHRRRGAERLRPDRSHVRLQEDEGIDPDLIVTARGIADGLPLSAVTGRAEIMDAPHVSGLGGTYGGNPVACAAALGTIATLEMDGLLDRAKEIERLMKDRLGRIQADDDRIGDAAAR